MPLSNTATSLLTSRTGSSEAMVISIFGDESSDESHERVFSVSGLVGTDDEWVEADALWKAATQGEEFHAAEWEHAKRFDDYKAATQALIASHVAGIVMSISNVRLMLTDLTPCAATSGLRLA
jgi:hypothetical protein